MSNPPAPTRRGRRASIFRKVRQFAKTQTEQWLAQEALQRLSLARRKALVRYCYANNEFYRRLWALHRIASLADLEQPGAFERLPITTKRSFLDTPVRERLSQGFNHDELVFAKTSGSTGQPFEFAYHRSIADHYAAREFRSISMAGCRPWHRIAFSRYQSIPFQLEGGDGDKQSLFGLFEVHRIPYDLRPPERLEALARVKPHFYTCYASYALEMARGVPEGALRQLNLKAVQLFSEHSTPKERRLISDAFGCPVFETYSAEEFFSLAARCEHGQFHMSNDELYVEIVDDDGRPVPDGEAGRVSITPFANRAMPLVRYALGDLGVLSSERCRCGRGTKVLQRLVGRQQEHVVLPDGRQMSWIPLISDLNDCESFMTVEGIQVVQERVDKIFIRYAGDHNASAEAELKACVLDRVGPGVDVVPQRVGELTRTKNGKLPSFIAMKSKSFTPRRAAVTS